MWVIVAAMSWTLFPKDTKPPSETARYTISYQGSNPWFDTGKVSKTTVRGHSAYKATRTALRESGQVVVAVKQRGR